MRASAPANCQTPHFSEGKRRIRSPEASESNNSRKRKVEFDRSKSSASGSELKLRRRTMGKEEDRSWVVSPDRSSYKDRFVFVSYNILGDGNASKHTDLYEFVDTDNLDWNIRKRRICTELRRYKPSIICLQEVDRFDDLASILRKDGFVGTYKGRTGEADDGCAIFWKAKRFSLLQQESIEFQKFGMRNNVAQLCVLKMHPNNSFSKSCKRVGQPTEKILPGQTLIVCNIHVLFNPNRGDIKLGQMRLLLERAHLLSQEWDNSPVVIAGDLNSRPKSPLYQFLSCSELDILLYDRRSISLQIENPFRQETFGSNFQKTGRSQFSMSSMKYRWSEEEILLAVGTNRGTRLQHSLKLCSAYPAIPSNYKTRDRCGEPLATSYHSKFLGTVDYIWHSQDLVPVGVMDTLPLDVLRKTGGLPCEKWGSDHLALGVRSTHDFRQTSLVVTRNALQGSIPTPANSFAQAGLQYWLRNSGFSRTILPSCNSDGSWSFCIFAALIF